MVAQLCRATQGNAAISVGIQLLLGDAIMMRLATDFTPSPGAVATGAEVRSYPVSQPVRFIPSHEIPSG